MSSTSTVTRRANRGGATAATATVTLTMAEAKALSAKEAEKKRNDQRFPSMQKVRSYLPKDVFQISAAKSFFYAVRDVSLVLGGVSLLYALASQPSWLAMPYAVRLALTAVIQFCTGFFMWCTFVVGHDCGHGTFSKDTSLNRFMGEITHSVVLCTPFYPWMLSHRQHHMHHNHVTKDYSHMWLVEEKKKELLADPGLGMFHSLRPLLPLLAWPVYLYGGLTDGGHLIQWGKLWEDRSFSDRAHGYASSAVTVATMFGIVSLLGWEDALRCYAGPWIWYAFFLFTVTYLQHHAEDTVVYGDKSWSYVQAGFETVDRTFGLGIDDFHHNITDGHVVHHLFFTKIPHYNLKRATDAMRAGLEKDGYAHCYKHEETRNFLTYIFTYVYQHFFFISEENIVA